MLKAKKNGAPIPIAPSLNINEPSFSNASPSVVNKHDKTHSIGLLTPSLVFAAYRKSRHANEKLQRTLT